MNEKRSVSLRISLKTARNKEEHAVFVRVHSVSFWFLVFSTNFTGNLDRIYIYIIRCRKIRVFRRISYIFL